MYTNGFKFILFCLIYVICVNFALGVLCFNCSSTHRSMTHCGEDETDNFHALEIRKSVVNCSGENALCFIRSWSARAKHAWIVQRGCYELNKDDNPPISLFAPTKSMTCKSQRFPDAEYNMCFCQGDRCNASSKLDFPHQQRLFLLFIVNLFINLCE